MLFLAALLAAPASYAARAVPPLTGRVHDEAGLISPAMRQRIDGMLFAYQQQTGHQLAVLTVRSLEGDPIEEFSMRVVEAWKLGDAERDDGVLLLVAVAERKLRIEVGYGLEGDLPDLVASRIIREVISPAFRRGEPEAGIVAGLQAIMRATGGADIPVPDVGTPQRSRPRSGEPPGGFGLLVLVMLLLLFLGGGRGGGAAWLALPFLLGGHRGGGHRGGGFGGGGGFRGGGGGFGGGGASGDW